VEQTEFGGCVFFSSEFLLLGVHVYVTTCLQRWDAQESVRPTSSFNFQAVKLNMEIQVLIPIERI